MNFNAYQRIITETSIYPRSMGPAYPALGLAGECGEVCDKIKKAYRDNAGTFSQEIVSEISKELGDVLWYLAALCNELGLDLNNVATDNIHKVMSRKDRNALHGKGDNR